MSWLKDYLSFSKRERNAFLGLLVIIGVFIFLPDLFSPRRSAVAIAPGEKKSLAPLKGNDNDEDESWKTPFSPPAGKVQPGMFVFDPNTLDEPGFIELGLPARTARTIINYRNKGGRFRKPADLRKIYSLAKEDADRIIPYARIKAYPSDTYNENRGNYERVKKRENHYTTAPIDINTATIEEWKSLPGIGEVLSARIVKFRQSIGGFASIEQVAKTYGLKDSVFQLIRPYLQLSAPAINRININTARENELMECPAISKDIARAIVICRQQKGPFTNVEDLKKIVFINEEMFHRIAPCLKVE